ncbi:hypothetical protein ACFLYA_01970 [Candidatus Dependentiae bacterium]
MKKMVILLILLAATSRVAAEELMVYNNMSGKQVYFPIEVKVYHSDNPEWVKFSFGEERTFNVKEKKSFIQKLFTKDKVKRIVAWRDQDLKERGRHFETKELGNPYMVELGESILDYRIYATKPRGQISSKDEEKVKPEMGESKKTEQLK